MSPSEQRILLVMGALAAVLAVFLGVLLVLGAGNKKPGNVSIKVATPARTPRTALITTPGPPSAPAGVTGTPAARPPSPIAATPTASAAATASPTQTATAAPTRTAVPTPPPTATRTPSPTAVPSRALPDLSLADFDLTPGGPGAGTLRITVSNLGQADLVQQGIEIIAIDQTDTEVTHFTSAPVTIAAGGSVTITSGYKPTRRVTLTVVINPSHSIAEADAPPGFDDPNNARTKSLTPP